MIFKSADKKNGIALGLILCSFVICTYIPLKILVFQQDTGYMYSFIRRDNYLPTIIEAALIVSVTAFIGRLLHNYFVVPIAFIIFSYIHVMLFPVLAAAAYIFTTFSVGYIFNKYIFRNEKGSPVFTGFMILTLIYSVLSIFRIGYIVSAQITAAVLFGASLVILYKDGWLKDAVYNIKHLNDHFDKRVLYLLVVIMGFLLFTVGRANTSLDYDSVWYGLESPYNLVINGSIYNDPKLIGNVFSYSKGFEVYMLPLTSDRFYGYFYAGNIMLCILVLITAYKIAAIYMDKIRAMVAAAILSSIPGVMNMSITAKSDIITLLVQLLMICSFCQGVINKEDNISPFYILSIYFYSLILKPTSLVFSSFILILLIIYSIASKIRNLNWRSDIGLLIISLLNIAAMWARTYMITGIPANQFYAKIFNFLGLKEHYPYNFSQGINMNESSPFSFGFIKERCYWLFEILFAPQNDIRHMDHVMIAWGTTIVIFLIMVSIAALLIYMNGRKEKDNADLAFPAVLLIEQFAVMIICVFGLDGVDGNYFMLLYSVAAICGWIIIEKTIFRNNTLLKRTVSVLLLVFLAINVMFTNGPTWAWTTGFSKIDLVNRGFLDHAEQYELEMRRSGQNEIFDVIKSNGPGTRVFAFSDVNINRLPCLVETYDDVNTFGNKELVSSGEEYVKLVKYADYDYIYISRDYDTNRKDVVDELVNAVNAAGLIEDMVVEEGNTLIMLCE